MLIEASGSDSFALLVEPEGMDYQFPPHEKVLLTFVIPEREIQYFDVMHAPDCLTVWRPADTEVWATLADGSRTQIGGFDGVPAPWLDSASELPPAQAPWSWPPQPD
jgi:hypothetical protein